MIEVMNRQLRRTAYLQNAYSTVESEVINDVGSLEFNLPTTDDKVQFCKPFHYARWINAETGEKGEMHRIIKPEKTKDEVPALKYTCEHVLATLADSVMPGHHVIGNIGVYTDEVIKYVLSFQTTQNWVLDECDFRRQFEYGWSNETVLNALWSIPNRFSEPYIWKVNTSTYPWRISLKRIDPAAPSKFFIRGGHNLLSMQAPNNAAGIITRIYPLGYGEGDNQLTIRSVNNGCEYLQSPNSIIEKYGIIERYFVDRRFEDAQSLKDQAQAILDVMQEPQLSVTVDITDLYQKTNDESDRIELGKIVTVVDEVESERIKSYITSIDRNRDEIGSAKITIANKPNDVASSIADLADKQRIEQVYSQGATQIYAQSVQANASTDKGAILRFYIPSDMRIVNFVNAKITLDRFRSYSKATGGGGATTQTSSSGGRMQATSGSGGGTYGSTSTGGESTQTSGASSSSTTGSYAESVSGRTNVGSAASGNSGQQTGQTGQTGTGASLPAHTHSIPNHTHSFSVGIAHSHGMKHTHSVSIPDHSHKFTVGSHSHTVNIPDHTHNFSLPDHTHDITQGIFEFGSPTGADIYINSKKMATMEKDIEIDISTYLLNDTNTIPRGSWLTVEVLPNDLAYITIDLIIKGFCQSRGGSTY